jgi:hypothetical protein
MNHNGLLVAVNRMISGETKLLLYQHWQSLLIAMFVTHIRRARGAINNIKIKRLLGVILS